MLLVAIFFIAADFPASLPLSPSPSPSPSRVWPSSLPGGPSETVPDFQLAEDAQHAFLAYMEEALVLHIRGASRAPVLLRNGRPLAFGPFGEGHAEIFAKSPRALDAAGSYRRMRITGMTAIALSGALAIATTVLTATNTWPWPYFFLGGGLTVTFGTLGGFLLSFSPAELSRAVAYYNEDVPLASPRPWLEDDER